MQFVIGGIHQKIERHFEDFVDFRRIDAQPVGGIDLCDDRDDAEAGAGEIGVEIADRRDRLGVQPDFLAAFAQSGRRRIGYGVAGSTTYTESQQLTTTEPSSATSNPDVPSSSSTTR